jgi:GT2 family glycosyltransferase
MEVSVVIPSVGTGRRERLLACVQSVLAAAQQIPGDVEIIAVVHGYDDGLPSELECLGVRLVDLSTRAPLSASRNAGAAHASGRLLFFVDDDNVIAPDCIARLAACLDARPDVFEVGPLMLYGDQPDRIWWAGSTRSYLFGKTHLRTGLPPTTDGEGLVETPDIPNAYMVRRAEFESVGGHDALRFPGHYTEADLGERLRRHTGGVAVCVPTARTWHFIGSAAVRRFHMTSPGAAEDIASHRAAYTAQYGDAIQRTAYLLCGQWLFGAAYLAAAMKLPPGKRRPVVDSYVRGMRRGMIQWRA